MKKAMIMFVFSFSILLIVNGVSADDATSGSTLNGIFIDLNSIIDSGKKDTLIYQIFSFVKEKMFNKQLPIIISKDDVPILSSAGFGYDDNGLNPRLIIDEKLIKRYETQPSLTLTVIIYELTYAYYYFTDKYFIPNREDIIEKHLYEMDALRVEAMFVTDYLVPKMYTLSGFEKYLVACQNINSLNSVSILFKKVDSDLLYKYYKYRIDYFSGKVLIGDYFYEMQNDCSILLKMIEGNTFTDEWHRYVFLISLHTMQYYVPILLNSILINKERIVDKNAIADYVASTNSNLGIIRNYLLSEENQAFIKKYSTNIISSFNQ